jgi:hypothetical protein
VTDLVRDRWPVFAAELEAALRAEDHILDGEIRYVEVLFGEPLD